MGASTKPSDSSRAMPRNSRIGSHSISTGGIGTPWMKGCRAVPVLGLHRSRGGRGLLVGLWDQLCDESFISTSPPTISAAATMRIGVACSPSTAMPTTNAPTAPMPVQMV
jgi:hypothetical protein